jgi:hypothetical protein
MTTLHIDPFRLCEDTDHGHVAHLGEVLDNV